VRLELHLTRMDRDSGRGFQILKRVHEAALADLHRALNKPYVPPEKAD
jgi:hypothetical protein